MFRKSVKMIFAWVVQSWPPAQHHNTLQMFDNNISSNYFFVYSYEYLNGMWLTFSDASFPNPHDITVTHLVSFR